MKDQHARTHMIANAASRDHLGLHAAELFGVARGGSDASPSRNHSVRDTPSSEAAAEDQNIQTGHPSGIHFPHCRDGIDHSAKDKLMQREDRVPISPSEQALGIERGGLPDQRAVGLRSDFKFQPRPAG